MPEYIASKNRISRVLCAVDLSGLSAQVMGLAAEVAEACDAPLTVLHSVELKVHRHEMEGFLAPYGGGPVACERALVEGSPARTVAAFAERHGAGLLVLGSHGRSRFASLLIGGVSGRVVHMATVPILAVRTPGQNQTLWQALENLGA